MSQKIMGSGLKKNLKEIDNIYFAIIFCFIKQAVLRKRIKKSIANKILVV
jgi:hypothetical protein